MIETNKSELVSKIERTNVFQWLVWHHFQALSHDELASAETQIEIESDTESAIPAYIVEQDSLLDDEPYETFGYYLYLTRQELLLKLDKDQWEKEKKIVQTDRSEPILVE